MRDSGSSFDIDVVHGEVGESQLRELLGGSKLEVKRDRRSWQTGNVAVEYRSRGKPSGIAVTKAEWWVFMLDDKDGDVRRIIFVKTERLREVARATYRVLGYEVGGDDDTSEMVLVPVEALIR